MKFNPNSLLDTPIVRNEIKRYLEIGYEYEYIVEKLNYVHKIIISVDELEMFINTKL